MSEQENRVTPVDRIAEAQYDHRAIGFSKCRCGWRAEVELGKDWVFQHERHQAEVIASLDGIAVVSSTPGTCVSDPCGEHRWVPSGSTWTCVDCHWSVTRNDSRSAGGAE